MQILEASKICSKEKSSLYLHLLSAVMPGQGMTMAVAPQIAVIQSLQPLDLIVCIFWGRDFIQPTNQTVV